MTKRPRSLFGRGQRRQAAYLLLLALALAGALLIISRAHLQARIATIEEVDVGECATRFGAEADFQFDGSPGYLAAP